MTGQPEKLDLCPHDIAADKQAALRVAFHSQKTLDLSKLPRLQLPTG
jgi:hypothetical protein